MRAKNVPVLLMFVFLFAALAAQEQAPPTPTAPAAATAPPAPTAPPTPQAAQAPPSVVAGIPVNYDEAKVGAYTLVDPLRMNDGKMVRDAMTWFAKRRPEIVELFETQQYGRAPGRPGS